ncbi:hypothetical protein BIFANG_03366 [Bifidobacterium angulatum DSM 20098 = JCM 7096]|uniref:Uncharacterized protein n=1 Tax=Bifidobacterium angulatum DSM 20098 = JCM 7096 TaxID=518635 RepID=C4FG97_9BIFI|nr:hypothetical protein BIFANG_03366 [Bifidobacterium angulatum DSM 20098 = JCM 7096]
MPRRHIYARLYISHGTALELFGMTATMNYLPTYNPNQVR